ncbi:hypothetical protein ACQKDM_27475, partial [Serratia proteamaculans]
GQRTATDPGWGIQHDLRRAHWCGTGTPMRALANGTKGALSDAARWVNGVNLPVDGGLAATYV